jgi:hypothetical protein
VFVGKEQTRRLSDGSRFASAAVSTSPERSIKSR